MGRRARLTPFGGVMLVLLALSVLALFLGSRGLQTAGFIVALIVAIVLVADQLPRMRLFGGGPWDPQLQARRRPRPGEQTDDRDSEPE